VVICLKQGANDSHMVQLVSLPPVISCLIKIQIGLTILVPLAQVVVEKRPLNGCLVSWFLSSIEDRGFSVSCGALDGDVLSWSPYGIGQTIIFLPFGFFLLSSIFFSFLA